MPNQSFVVDEKLNQLDSKVLLSTVSPIETFLDTQVAADIKGMQASLTQTVTDLKTKAPTDPQVQLDLLQFQRGLAIGTFDQQLDVTQDPGPKSLSEIFFDDQVTVDLKATGTDFTTFKADLTTLSPADPKIQLDELKLSRDLMIAQIDQDFDLRSDAPTAPTTPETPTTPEAPTPAPPTTPTPTV